MTSSGNGNGGAKVVVAPTAPDMFQNRFQNRFQNTREIDRRASMEGTRGVMEPGLADRAVAPVIHSR